MDLIIRVGGKEKTTFVFFDTGLEYSATKEHLDFLERKYDVEIIREKALKPIPISIQEYGAPFWSKYASDMIYRLQYNNFNWENKSFDELIQVYPKCTTALKWWCNIKTGKTTQFVIERAPYLK